MKDFSRGVFRENPIFVILVGLCPALAVTSRLVNALVMGACVTAVLLGTGLLVSLLRNFLPVKFRIPAVLLIITALVTSADLLLKAFAPALSTRLGMYVPLIAVNCLILGRAGTYAFNHAPGRAALDAVGMGAGFTLALGLIALVRELVGSGTVSFPAFSTDGPAGGTIAVSGLSETPVAAIATPIGAFLIVGFLMGFINSFDSIKSRAKAVRRALADAIKGKGSEGDKRGSGK